MVAAVFEGCAKKVSIKNKGDQGKKEQKSTASTLTAFKRGNDSHQRFVLLIAGGASKKKKSYPAVDIDYMVLKIVCQH
jgi:hypothetical protein